MRTMMRMTVLLSLLVGAVGCGGDTAVKEPEQFAPLPDPSSISGSDGKLKTLGSESGKKMTAPLPKR